MIASFSDEALLLLYSVAVGAALGALWDIFRIIRIAFSGRKKRYGKYRIRLPADGEAAWKAMHIPDTPPSFRDVPLFFCDLAFCLISAVSVILLLFQLSDGKFRGFALSGALAGFAVYLLTVGRIVIFFSEKLIGAIKKVILTALSFTLFPLSGIIKRALGNLSAKIEKRRGKKRSARLSAKLIHAARSGFGYKP